jgi:hypothetical protein
MARLRTRPGFDWNLVAWGPPDSRPRPLCSYCHAKIDDDDVPLMFFSNEGACAKFCDKCVEEWFGLDDDGVHADV